MTQRLNAGLINRAFWLVLCGALPTMGTAIAQTQTLGPPNIEILKLKWQKQIRLPRNFDPAVIPEGPAFTDPTIRTSSSAPMTGQDAVRVASSNQSTAAVRSSTEFPASPRRLPTFYIYSMKLKNTGIKTIDAVAWDYVFSDAAGVELGRHQFVSYENIRSNHSVTLRGERRSPPTRIVTAPRSEKGHLKPGERATIQCIFYADDTTWHNPQGPIDACLRLTSVRETIRRKRVSGRS